MKNTLWSSWVICLISLTALEGLAQAKSHKKHVAEEETTIHYKQAAPEAGESSSRSERYYGLGFSTITNTAVANSTVVGNGSISGIYGFDRNWAIHGLFSIPG